MNARCRLFQGCCNTLGTAVAGRTWRFSRRGHQREREQQLVARVGEAATGELLDLLHPVDHGVAVAEERLGRVRGRAVVAQQRGERLQQRRRPAARLGQDRAEGLARRSSGATCGLPASSTSGSRSATDDHPRLAPRQGLRGPGRELERRREAGDAVRATLATPIRPAACGASSSTSPRSSGSVARRAARSRRPARTCQCAGDAQPVQPVLGRRRARSSSDAVVRARPRRRPRRPAPMSSASRASVGELRVGAAALEQRVERRSAGAAGPGGAAGRSRGGRRR